MISAVVVSFRTGPALGRCIDALLRQPELRDLTLIDNGNDHQTRQILDQLADPRVRVLRPGRNLGFAAACNLGARHGQGAFVALINPDLIVSDGCFAAALKAFRDFPLAWLCGGRLEGPDGREQRGGRREILTPWRALVETLRLERLFPGHPHFRRLNLHEAPPVIGTIEVPATSGAFMVLPRDKWDQLGGLDERYFLHIEDMDLCYRVHQHKGKILYCGDISLLHHKGSSDAARTFVEWHKTLSAGRYFRQHFRETYPNWVLMVVISTLWIRFAMTAARHAIPDIFVVIIRFWRFP